MIHSISKLWFLISCFCLQHIFSCITLTQLLKQNCRKPSLTLSQISGFRHEMCHLSNPRGQYATVHIGLIWKFWSPTPCTPTENSSWHQKIHELGFHPALTHASNNLPSAKSVTFFWEGSSAWQGKTQEASAQQFMQRVRYLTVIKQARVGVTDFRFFTHFSLLPFVLPEGR